MPLSVEFYHPKYDKWAEVAEVVPGQLPVIMPQFMPDGERRIYAIECDEKDEFSYISTYNVPDELENDEIGLVHLDEIDANSVITVEKNHAYFISIKSDKEIERLVVRFTQT